MSALFGRHVSSLFAALTVAVGLMVGLATPAFAVTPPLPSPPSPVPAPPIALPNVPSGAVPGPVPYVNGTDPMAPGPKRDSPPSDLSRYPKERGLPRDKPASGHDAGGTVVSRRLDLLGVEWITYYLPAPNITPAQLVDNLRAANIPAELLDGNTTPAVTPRTAPDPPVPPPGSPDCSYGMARALYSNGREGQGIPCRYPARWGNEGLPHPQVRFDDHTSGKWHIDTAVYQWNKAQGIDSLYLRNTCPFKPGSRCVDVSDRDRGYDNGVVGETTTPTNPIDGDLIDGQVTVVFNDFYLTDPTYRLGPTQPLTTSCHELGHALGLDHNLSQKSCLYYAVDNVTTPDADDYGLLARMYVHPR
jgi:hypothetical protein